MSRTILLATGGSMGDVHPFLMLARSLKARGAEPLLLTNPGLCKLIEPAGIETHWLGEPKHTRQVLRERPEYMSLQGGKLVLRELFIPQIAPTFEAVQDIHKQRGIAAIVAHPGCFGAVWAGWKLNLPVAMVHLSPASLFATHDLGCYPAWQRVLLRCAIPLGKRAGSHWLGPTARQLGIDCGGDLLTRSMHGTDLLLGLWSKHFRAPCQRDLPNLRTCGFPASFIGEELSPAVEKFLNQNERPLVAVAMGSSAVHVAGRLYRQAAEAIEALNCRGIFVCGSDDRPDYLPAGSLAVSFTSFHRLFPHCDAVIHHGGIGTTAEGLRAGCPALVLPFGHDQFENVARLRQLGVGQGIWQRRANAKRIRRKLAQLLAPAVAGKAKKLADQIAVEDNGADAASELILKHIAK